MSFFERALRASPTSTLAAPADWLTAALTGGGTSYAGETVDVKSALGLAPFYRGVQVLSGAVGMMPCKVYLPDGKEAPRTSRPWHLLHTRANEPLGLAADEWWSIVESHLDTWGNHLSWMEPGPDGRTVNLWPIAPSRVRIGMVGRERVYVVDGDEGNPYGASDFLHIRGLSLDGIVGYSPLQLHRHTLGSEQARQKFKGRFWKNDATPGVTLVHPQKLAPEALDRIKALWEKHHRGVDNARKVAVLGEGMDIHQMTMPLADAQFVEQARMSATEQALVLGIPPYMVAGDNGGNSLTYTTTEGQSVDFLKWSLSARLVRLQNAVSLNLGIMPQGWTAEFETGAVLRSTTKERYAAWSMAPHLLIDEMRAMDNLEPLPNGAGQVLAKTVKGAVAPTTKGSGA